MSWMKPDGASLWIIDGISQKVIQVDQHGTNEHGEGGEPSLSIPGDRNGEWDQEMQGNMNQR